MAFRFSANFAIGRQLNEAAAGKFPGVQAIYKDSIKCVGMTDVSIQGL
jgi:hypothetical protein